MHNDLPVKRDDGREYWLVVRDARRPGGAEILYCEEMLRTRRDFEAAIVDDIFPVVEAVHRAAGGTVTRIGIDEIEALQANLAQHFAAEAADRRQMLSGYRSAAL